MTARILIIEDDEAILKFLRRGLAYEGYQVNTATDGQSGLALARDNPPDLVVLDLVLPDGEGTELVPELRRHHPETPIAVLSARDDIEEAASKAGADAAIPKETPLPEIISSFRKLVG